MRILVLFFVVVVSLQSCSEDNLEEVQQQIVVEGWIDAGGFPVVILTKTLPVSSEEITLNWQDYLIKWARVTVSDGENEIVLTGKTDLHYYPPYIYTTGDMRGVAGKKYKLTVSYMDFYAEAETTIPSPVELKGIIGENINGKYSLRAVIDDCPNEKNYYKFFMGVEGRDYMYLSSNLAVIDDADYDFPAEIILEKGNSVFYYDELRDYVVTEKDRLFIKFAQIDSIAYNYWNEYKNVVTISRNPFFRFVDNLSSNIIGGTGYWFGYGSTEYICEPFNHNIPIKID